MALELGVYHPRSRFATPTSHLVPQAITSLTEKPSQPTSYMPCKYRNIKANEASIPRGDNYPNPDKGTDEGPTL